MARSRLIVGLVALVSLTVVWPPPGLSQSGRGTTRPGPAPRPTPKPNTPVTTVLGIPDGGKLTKQDMDGVTSRFLLRNGLTVIIRERHSAPLVSVNIAVKAGTVNEPDELAGLARLTRQMILRGTPKRAGAAIDKEVSRVGGIFTSSSSIDRTSFNVVAPAESYQGVVELLADLILHPAFNPDDIKKAAQAVLIESKREQDHSESAALDQLFAAAFTVNRLKRGNAVSDTMLSSATREQVQAFYQNFYTPSNTVVTVIGDIFSLQALGQAQLQFGEYRGRGSGVRGQGPETPKSSPTPSKAAQPNSPAPVLSTTAIDQSAFRNPQSAIEEPVQDKLRYSNARADIGPSLVSIGYRTPAIKTDKEGLKEFATMQVLAAVLGLGNGSRLNQGLREGQASRDKLSVANETGASFLALPGAGMLVVRLAVDADRIDRAEAEYFREIERFRRELISEGELQRARVMLEKQYLDSVSRFEDETALLGRFQAQFGDYRLFDSNLARLRAVTASEVQQAAAKYLTLANTTVHELEPRIAPARTFTPEKFAELIVTFAASAAQPIKPEEVKQAIALKTFSQGSERGLASEGQNVIVASVPLPIKDYSVLRGPRAYVREDKSQLKLTVSVFFQGGRLVEDATTSGMTELMLRSMLKSTTTRKADLISLELETYGGEIRVINEADFFGYTLDVLSRNAENAIKLLLDLIENPYFDKDEAGRERNALLARQLQERDDDEARSLELLWASLYPNHPHGLPRFGIADVIKAVNEEKLEAWHGKTIKRQLPVVVLVGDTDGSALVSRIFSDGLKRAELDKALKVSIPTYLPQPQDQIEMRDRQLTTQAIGFRVTDKSLTSANDLVVLKMLGYLAASGKLSEELRDKQGLTDAVAVMLDQRLASGGFIAQLATLPGNEQRARETVLAELQRLGSAPAADDEFEQGRNASIGRYAIFLQSHQERALEYSRAVMLGLKPADIEAQPDLVRAVKKTDLKRVAENLVKASQSGRGVVRGK